MRRRWSRLESTEIPHSRNKDGSVDLEDWDSEKHGRVRLRYTIES